MNCWHCYKDIHQDEHIDCPHCGQSYSRESLEEVQGLAFLRVWLEERHALLGDSVGELLKEVKTAQLSAQQNLLKPQMEAIQKELSLTKACLERCADWGQSAHISNSGLGKLRQALMTQSEALSARLGPVFPATKTVKELDILHYALGQIPNWRRESTLDQGDIILLKNHLSALYTQAADRLSKNISLHNAMLSMISRLETDLLTPAWSAKLREKLRQEIAELMGDGTGHPIKSVDSTRKATIEFASEALVAWAEGGEMDRQNPEFRKLSDYLDEQRLAAAQPAPTPKPAAPPATAAPKPAPARRAKPKPKRPPIDWAKTWDKTIQLVVSGALLRGLLYLGAFMIVVSLTILVVRFWDLFPAIVQVVFIFSVPTVFYLAGWLVRSRLKLPQAGNVLSGVGALLVAVDFAAIYQLGGLEVALAPYWLITSLICTSIYALTAWKLEGQFFDYIALIGGGSAIMALTIWVKLSSESSILALMVYGLLLLLSAARMWGSGEGWRDTAMAMRYLPQALFPVALTTIARNIQLRPKRRFPAGVPGLWLAGL